MDARELVVSAIKRLNDSGAVHTELSDSPAAPLYGTGSALDSLDLVNLVVALEGTIHDETGRSVVLAKEEAFDRPESPFATVGSVTAYVEELLRAEG